MLVLETCYITNSHLLQIFFKNLWLSGQGLHFFLVIFCSLFKGTIGKDMLFEQQRQTHCKARNNEDLV